MKRLMKRYHSGERGMTLLEILIVVVILGILAGLLIPRLLAFTKTGHVAAANDELAKIETAVWDYYADTDTTAFPVDCNTIGSNNSLMDGPGTEQYISKAAKYYNYTFNSTTGEVNNPGTVSLVGSLNWNSTGHKWQKQAP